MSFEDIKRPINIEGVPNHARELELRLFKAQLIFLEKESQQSENKSKTYLELFKDITSIILNLKELYGINLVRDKTELPGEEVDKLKDEYALGLEIELTKIAVNTEDSPDERIDQIYNYIAVNLAKFPVEAEKNENESCGLIYFQLTKAREAETEFDLKAGDDFLEIHFSPAFTQSKDPKPNELRQWLAQLAEVIVSKYPQTVAVTGSSWLFDHPIMKRLGFTVKPESEKPQGGGSYWNQLIDKDGQIDSKRFDFLLKNGELPYKKAAGIIMTEDFLRRYLPADKRGTIILKRVDIEKQKQREVITTQIEEVLKKNWDSIIEKQMSVDELFTKIPDFVDVARSLGLEKELRAFFEQFISRRYTLEMIKKDEKLLSEFRPVIAKIEAKIMEDGYIDYEVNI